jgi:TonB family protein
MNSSFGRNLAISAAAHGFIILLLIFGLGFTLQDKPKENIQWIDLASGIEQLKPTSSSGGQNSSNPNPTPSSPTEIPSPQPAQPIQSSPPVPQPQQQPQEVPQPPVEPSEPIIASKPTPTQKPKPPVVKPPTKPPPVQKPPSPPKKESPKETVKPKNPTPSPASDSQTIKPGDKKVTRVVANTSASTPVTNPPPTPGESFDAGKFAKNLLGKLPNGDGLVTQKDGTGSGTSATGQKNDFADYFNKIFVEMYNAWQSPFGIANGTETLVTIRIEKNGNISKVSLASSSGKKEMDDSALTAANSVKKLPPLPDGLGSSYAEITVHFKVQK